MLCMTNHFWEIAINIRIFFAKEIMLSMHSEKPFLATRFKQLVTLNRYLSSGSSDYCHLLSELSCAKHKPHSPTQQRRCYCYTPVYMMSIFAQIVWRLGRTDHSQGEYRFFAFLTGLQV